MSESLDWLLANFVQQVASARSAVVASTDGVRMHAHDLDTAAADRLAAVATGLFSLGGGIGTDTVRGVRQVLVEHEDVVLCVMAAGPGAVLAVLAEPDADLGVIGYEMGQLVKRVPTHLTSPARTAVTAAPGHAR
ncbi:roadblock/LC7 domain-containing protein [Streptomyces phytophilus]|uniref:roadblock/LC7 domain-containing protein n=1 Tax=Streptomyces phytophilus TaxID=722715 RepID=UPI0015F059C2|nr:roadblock/LC7 domain-containing protein [Streptomyces phytophilus]